MLKLREVIHNFESVIIPKCYYSFLKKNNGEIKGKMEHDKNKLRRGFWFLSNLCRL